MQYYAVCIYILDFCLLIYQYLLTEKSGGVHSIREQYPRITRVDI